MKLISLLLVALLSMPGILAAKVKVVASTADLAYFAEEIGGELIEIERIAPPNADIHFIEVRPSYMVKVSKADVALKVGLELDMWMDQIIDGSRNSRLIIVDCSRYIKPLEVPTFKADARYGDLHRFGNPHYWLGPQNVGDITQAIVEGLTEADAANADAYKMNRERFLEQLNSDLAALQPEIDRLKGLEAVYYHNSWPYFDRYVGITAVDFIEPYPGVAPSPSHVKELAEDVSSRGIKVIGVEPYFDKRVPEKIASESGAKVVTLYPSIKGRSGDESYVMWFKGNLDALLQASGR